MGNYQLKAIEAMQVPIPLEHEAAKDLEARYAKFCAWLDEKGMTEIDFTLPRKSQDAEQVPLPGYVTFSDPTLRSGYIQRELAPIECVEGFWLWWSADAKHFMIWPNEMFNALYEEV